MNKSINSLETVYTHWVNALLMYLPRIFFAIIILVVFVFLARVVRRISFSFFSRAAIKKHADVVNVVATFIYFFFLLSGVVFALQIAGWEIMITHILAGAGIVGIVAGFAFKDIASNIFAGLLLKIQNPYKQGDWVEIDGKYGVVLDVSWITTKIKTTPGQEVFVPNQIIYSGTFTNFSTWGKRRIVLKSGVSYGDDLEHVRKVALDEVNKIALLLPEEGVDFYFTDIGSSSYDFMLRFWIKFESNDDFCKGMNDAIMHIKKRFEQENISLAYTVTTLDFGVKGGVNIFDKEIQIKH